MEETLTYKAAMEEIEHIVLNMEENKLDVDDLSRQVKRLSELLAYCKAKLHETEKEVEDILKTMGEDGK